MANLLELFLGILPTLYKKVYWRIASSAHWNLWFGRPKVHWCSKINGCWFWKIISHDNGWWEHKNQEKVSLSFSSLFPIHAEDVQAVLFFCVFRQMNSGNASVTFNVDEREQWSLSTLSYVKAFMRQYCFQGKSTILTYLSVFMSLWVEFMFIPFEQAFLGQIALVCSFRSLFGII